MAALEDRVLTKVLKSGSFQEVVKRGLCEEHFLNPDSRMIFRFLKQHWYNPNTNGTLPTIQRVRQRWPAFTLTATSQDEEGVLTALIDELKMKAFESDVWSMSEYFKELVEEDPVNAIQVLKKRLLEIEVKLNTGEQSNGMGVQEILSMAKEHYEGAQTGAIFGVPWPWQCLTEDTLGKRGGDFVVFYGRMKSMKCVCEGQRVMMPDGALLPIEEVPELCKAPSFTETTGRIRMAKARRVVSGTKDSVEVVTESGLRLRTSKDHLYMVPGGKYRRIKDLRVGNHVATARSLPEWSPDKDQVTPEDAHLLGLLVGDGNYTRADQDVLQALRRHAARHNCVLTVGARPIEFRVRREATEKHNKVLTLLKDLGIHGSKGPEKRIPRAVFTSSRESIAAFIAGYLDTDGHVKKVVRWESASQGLIGDLQHLLLRFGIRARANQATTNYGTEAYSLTVYTKKDAQTLDRVVGPFLSSERKRKALTTLGVVTGPTRVNTDAIPWTKELESTIIAAKQGYEWPKSGLSKMDKSKLFQSGRISRRLLTKLAEAFDSDELRNVANQDIAWERIKSITPIGQVPCYDICIEDGQDPNFVVEGFVVHNTWILLYCAAVDYLNHNKRVLIWSKEMSPLKLGLRLATLLSRVDYQLFKKGLLPPKMREHCFAVLESLTTGRVKHDLRRGAAAGMRDLLMLAGRQAPRSLEGLKEKVEEFEPDVIYLDSFYHMDSLRSEQITVRWQRVATMAEDVKAYAEDVHLPIVAVHQANRLGEKTYGNTLADLADADVIAREADLIIRVLKSPGYIGLHEEDYEEEFVRVLRDAKAAPSPIRRRLPRIKLGVSEVDDKRTVNSYLMDKLSAEAGIKRVGGELALVMGGNREGTLEAFTIKAIPSYNFSLITDKPDMKRIKDWMKIDDKDDDTPAKKERAEPKTASDFNKALANSGMK